MPEQNKNKDQSALSRTASAAGAAKGAAAGPYGMLAAGLWENRKAIGKILAAIGALLLIPVLFLLMLPSLIFGNLGLDTAPPQSGMGVPGMRFLEAR